MSARKFRPVYGLLALCMATIGATALFLGQTNAATTAPTGPTIEISAKGFNPPICDIGRNDEVVWKNVDTRVHRVIIPPAGEGPPPIEVTGDIQPGQTSGPLIPGAGGNIYYQDFYDPTLKGIVHSPQGSNSGPINCSPLTPTPTPTATPIATATPSPTPTPLVVANCRAQALGAPNPYGRCAVAINVAQD
jgi:hypothetical protein